MYEKSDKSLKRFEDYVKEEVIFFFFIAKLNIFEGGNVDDISIFFFDLSSFIEDGFI